MKTNNEKEQIKNNTNSGVIPIPIARNKTFNVFPNTINKKNKIIQNKRRTVSKDKEINQLNKNFSFPKIEARNSNSRQNKDKEKTEKPSNNLPKININTNQINDNSTNNPVLDKSIIKYIEDLIDFSNAITNRNLFNSLVNSFNKKYILNYKDTKIDDNNFLLINKYSNIITVCLIFLSKDDNNYKFSNERLKILYEQFIFTSCKNIKGLSSQKIKNFIKRMKPTKKALIHCVNAIIKLLFNNKNEYNSLKGALNQLINEINKNTLKEMNTKITESILYCYNKSIINYSKTNNTNTANNTSNNFKAKNKKFIQNNKKFDSKNKNNKNNAYNNINVFNHNKEEQNISNEVDINPPFIKTKLQKKFCLVLDIDETISHTIKLPSGDYFFVRPGVRKFLKEIVDFYEIVIFTSSPKSYADNILDKIDYDNEFFSYRLYRSHVVYEKGESVKKLDMIGRELNKIIFVDNLKANAKYNMNNLYHIKTWINDLNDNELVNLKNKLKNIAISGKYDNDITKAIPNI